MGNSGEGLVGVIVAGFILSIALASFLQSQSNTDKQLSQLHLRQDLEQLRRYVRAFTSCSRTMIPLPSACHDGGKIEVRQPDGKLLISDDGNTRLGRFQVQAKCQSPSFNIQVKTDETGAWKDLFDGIPFRCQGGGGPSQSGCTYIGQIDSSEAPISCSTPAGCGLPGQVFREGGKEFQLKVGYEKPVESIEVEVRNAKGGRFDPKGAETEALRTTHHNTLRTRIAAAGASYFSPAEKDLPEFRDNVQYLVPFPSFVPPNDWYQEELTIRATGKVKDSDEKMICEEKLSLFSPIVLDLSGKENLKTLSISEAGVLFDLDANGSTERVGWVAPPGILLARDLNGNGKIDDGRELFGQATLLRTGLKAPNGYEALKDLDTEGRGYLDEELPVFKELLGWSDRNANGKSEPGELVPITKLGITRLSVAYLRVPEFAHPGENPILYQSRFFGPKACGSEGCRSYDVFFLSVPLSSPEMSRSSPETITPAGAPSVVANRLSVIQGVNPSRAIQSGKVNVKSISVTSNDPRYNPHFTVSQFGRLPDLPTGYEPKGPDNFVSLVSKSGAALPATHISGTEIRKGDTSCLLSDQSPLYLVAQRRDLYIARLEKPCDSITEGYIAYRKVRVVPPMPF